MASLIYLTCVGSSSLFVDIPTTRTMQMRVAGHTEEKGWCTATSELQSLNAMGWLYERGFGDLNTEFWYGLRNIHCLTTREEVELQIEVRQNDGTGQVWTYGYFVVDGPENNYTLHIGQAEGPSHAWSWQHNPWNAVYNNRQEQW